jgi:anti-sigma factor RsiW
MPKLDSHRGISRLRAQSASVNRHASYEALALYVLDDLSVKQTAAMQEHLLVCARCVEKLPEIRAVVAALRSAA